MEDVNPNHYHLPIQPADYITLNQLNFNRGNVVKYVTRAGRKNPEMTIKDLEKAKTYIDMEIAALKGDMPSSVFRENMKDTESIYYADYEMG